jgi:chromosome segregation ATPase
MGKTKAEEYDALSQIRGILKDFDPEDTCIGKAFEGCVGQAEENICNGLMLSFRSLYESRDRDALRLNEKLTEVTKKLRESEEARVNLVKELNKKDDAIARLEDAKNQLESQIVGEELIRRDYEARIGQMESDYKALQISYEGLKAAKKQEAAAEVHALRQTIIELKAKLYDMMAGEEVEE